MKFLFSLLFIFSMNVHAESITALKAKEMIDEKKAVLVDVREVNEAAEGMAAPAILIPKSKIDAEDNLWKDFLNATPKDKPIILYCRSGRRSGIVEEKLKALGYKQLYNLGGFSNWEKEKLPIKKYN